MIWFGKLSAAFLMVSLVGCTVGGVNLSDTAADEERSEESENRARIDPQSTRDLESLFLDSSDIKPDRFELGLTACARIPLQEDLNDTLYRWPEELKAFAIEHLEKFPELQVLLDSVDGIFLVNGRFLSFDSWSFDDVAGLMCDTDEKKNYVFLNYEIFVYERAMYGKLNEWQDIRGVLDTHVVSSHGDQFLFTMLHEIFHAIDHAQFLNKPSSEAAEKRETLLAASWDQNETSRFGSFEGLALKHQKLSCIHGQPDKAFSLQSTSAEKIAQEYKDFTEKTNFISFYAATNLYEDVADTLVTWHFLRTYDNGLNRKVYEKDLSDGRLGGAQPIYEFDTKTLAIESSSHQKKVCDMVALVFPNTPCGLGPETPTETETPDPDVTEDNPTPNGEEIEESTNGESDT